MSELEAKVVDIVRQQVQLEETTDLSRDSKLQDLGIDSIQMLSLVAKLEREFDIEIYDSEYGKLVTVGNACDVVRAHHVARAV